MTNSDNCATFFWRTHGLGTIDFLLTKSLGYGYGMRNFRVDSRLTECG